VAAADRDPVTRFEIVLRNLGLADEDDLASIRRTSPPPSMRRSPRGGGEPADPQLAYSLMFAGQEA